MKGWGQLLIFAGLGLGIYWLTKQFSSAVAGAGGAQTFNIGKVGSELTYTPTLSSYMADATSATGNATLGDTSATGGTNPDNSHRNFP
jgi:hypothetical protein